MKITEVAVLCACLLVAPLAASGPSRAAESGDASNTMVEGLGRMMIAVRYLAHEQNLGCDDKGISLAGVLLMTGKAYTLTREFHEGETYVLVGWADSRARDVDLQLTIDGLPLLGDTDDSAMAMFEFKPWRTAEYGIRLSLPDAQGGAFCAFAVLRRGGWNVPLNNLVAAGDNLVEQCRRVSQVAGWFGNGASLPVGQAAVWGGVFRGGDSQKIGHIELGHRQTFAVATGDHVEADWDLFLEDGEGNVLCEDIRPGSTASVATVPRPGRFYSVRLKNASDNGPPSFGMFGLVQVGK